MSTRRWRIASTRSLAALLAVIVLATIEAWSMVPAQGRDLSGAITSVRAGQIAAESSMRAADKRIKVLKRQTKRAARHLRKARRSHDDAIERRDEANAQVRDVKARLASARDELERQRHALTGLLIELDLGPRISGTSATSATFVLGAVAGSQDDRTAHAPSVGPAGEVDPALARIEASVAGLEADVAHLGVQAHVTERSARKVARKTRKAGRRERTANQRVRRIKAGIHSATGQQQGSEASLAAYIHSMTRLAHLRANKKTKGKSAPGFIMPVNGRLTQGYSGHHDGLDLAAGQGTPIRAMAQGVVAYVGWNPWDSRPRAFVVVIAHQGGYETKYGHLLPRRGVTLGKLVRRGEVIGYMGNTGHSTGVHLHLEVSRGFHTISPYAVL